MLSSYLRRDRILLRGILASAWIVVALGGVSAILFTPTTIENELGTLLTYIWGGISAIASIIAAIGVLTNRYRLEWAAAWFAGAGLAVYGGVVWWLVVAGSTTRLTQAFLISALILHTVYRALSCGAHARKLRIEHLTHSGAINVLRT